MIPFLVYLFFLHWVGDFVFQSSWMAINKSKDFLALLTHVTIYSCILALGVALSFQYPNGLQWFFLANFVAHLATDLVTSKFTGSFWTKLIRNATSRNRNVLIDPEYAWNLFLNQNRRCYFSGIDLYLPGAQSKHNKTNASIDRLNSSLSYVEGNVCWVDKSINMMKGTLSPAKFVEICHLVSENNTYESNMRAISFK
jgi:hypothetical protein